MRKAVLLSILLISFASRSVLADCRPQYQAHQELTETHRNASVYTMMGQVTMVAVGAVSPATKHFAILHKTIGSSLFAITLAGTVFGSFYYASPDRFLDAKALIDEAYVGKGKNLSSVASAFGVDEGLLARKIVVLNEQSQFCSLQKQSSADLNYLASRAQLLTILEKQDLGPVTR